MTDAPAGDEPDTVRTARLVLTRPVADDLPGLHALLTDPRVWTHLPSGRHTTLDRTRTLAGAWLASWRLLGLGTWVVRTPRSDLLLGYGGCTLAGGDGPGGDGSVWNLGYRIDADAQGRGYAGEVAEAGIRHAASLRPDLPVTAYLLEHNTASARVVARVGLELVHRGPDPGNPDPDAVRLVFADRPLSPARLATTLT